MRKLTCLLSVLLVSATSVSIDLKAEEAPADGEKPSVPHMELTSTAFKEGEMIPGEYTCRGLNLSPPLSWSKAPAGTESLVLICEDLDAPYGKIFTHWVMFNMPKDTRELPERVPPVEKLENGAQQGINDFKKIGYRGPCPPGGTHRYVFKVYALNSTLLILGTPTRKDVTAAMEGHVLAEGQLMGRFKSMR